MAWVRVDDAFYDHPKFQNTNALGIAAWITALAWSNRNLTDGYIPRSVAARLVNLDGISLTFGMAGRDANAYDGIDQLLDCGAWVEVEGGYQIVNYLEFQPSADEVKARREGNALRQAQFRRRKAEQSDSNAGSNGVTNGDVTRAPNPNTQKIKTIAHADARAGDPAGEDPEVNHGTKGPSTPLAATEFDQFWHHYPRKVGKAKAAKAWREAIRHVDPPVVVEAARRLAADPNLPEKRFIPHPTEWLRRGGWDDEPYPGQNAPAVRLVRPRCPEHPSQEQPCATCAAEVHAGLRRTPA